MNSDIFRSPFVVRLIQLALDEDLSFGDLTSELCVPLQHESVASVVAREKMRVCGLPIADYIFAYLDASVEIEVCVSEGKDVEAQTELLRLRGQTQALLSAERTLLNFLQRMSGVATHTARIVAHAGELDILDTRKTIPGWRVLDKYATSVGGARNHRMHLGELIMIKDNHVDASERNLSELIEDVVRKKPPYVPVEVEVRSLSELDAALCAPVDILLLDNMNDRDMELAVDRVASSGKQVLVEASGGIDEHRFGAITKAGVVRVSLGSLTTQARNVDIAMDMREAV